MAGCPAHLRVSNRMICRTIVPIATLILLCSAFCPAADSITCPETISTRQELTAPVPGWTPMQDDTPHSLSGITFYDGPPAEKASLVYDQITPGKSEQIATWRFAPQTGRRIWLACSYAGTAIQLTKGLPPNISICSVTYDPQQSIAGLPVIRKITCR
jgi:hypothetical protein